MSLSTFSRPKASKVFALFYCLVICVVKQGVGADREGLEFFESKIRPVLVRECYSCHSDAASAAGKLRGGLRLDTRQATHQGGESGPAVVPGELDESLLISAIRHESFEMPPKMKLPEAVIQDFVKWIEMGAPDPRDRHVRVVSPSVDILAGKQFWSFQPLAIIEPPVTIIDAQTDIDRFIGQKLAEHHIAANGLAEPRVLVRRAWFDLLGLPPTPEELEHWVGRLGVVDAEPLRSINRQAWSELIDHLLGSPHHGERWARHWIDIARFAESHGYEQDYDRPNAYYYRDFLIQAFNNDLPYDDFVRWQLAGDELEPNNPLAWMATGFLGGGAFPTQLTENEFESARYDELDDMVATTGVAFLGLSVGCARCHDHKFDPIPTADYYRMAATFTSAIRTEKEFDLQPEENARRRAEYEQQLRKLKRTLSEVEHDHPAWQTASAALRQHEAAGPEVTLNKVMVTSEGLPPMSHHADGRGFPHFYPATFQLRRGDVAQKGDQAEPGFLQVLMPAGFESKHWTHVHPSGSSLASLRRSALAAWITDPKHGAGELAARVMVNRLWQHHFGRGLVDTPNDFGASGQRPTHPELLDWLARQLIQGDWRLKPLHKQIMLSAAYLRSAEVHSSGDATQDARLNIDPHNQWLWRRSPMRLEAEAIRDAMLVVSGRLDASLYGPGTLDQDMHRRSVYFFIKRSGLIPMMMLFDWPEHLVSIGQRASTTIAPQALMFMNSPQGRDYAEGFAKRIDGDDLAACVQRAYRSAVGRGPSHTEQAMAVQFIEEQFALRVDEADDQRRWQALADFCQVLMSTNEFVYVE